MSETYTFPESAFTDRDTHDRDGWCHETSAEYADMTRASRHRGEDEDPCYNVLFAHQEELRLQRAAKFHAEVERENEALRRHPITGEPLDIGPGTTADDFLGLPEDFDLPAAVTQRTDLFSATLSSHHADGQHPNGGHIFCSSCRPLGWLSLARKLTLDFRFDPTTIDVQAKGWIFADGTTDAEEAGSRFLTLAELRDLQAPEMLIDRVLPASSYGILSGRDGTWKTFLALDLGCTLAAGLEGWRGEDVGPWDPSPVLFLAGEGAGQLPSRVDAWCAHNGVDQERLESLTFMPSVPNLFTGGPAYDAVLDWATEHQPELIVVDTLRRASGAADQNSARDMGLVVDRIHALKEASGGTVLVVAHTDKGDNDTRGASNVEDDADFVLHVKRKEGPLRQELSVTKMKDAPDDFTLTTYPTAVSESIVLADQPDELAIAWTSTSMDNRIAGALRGTAALGPLTKPEIRQYVSEDGHGAVSRHCDVVLNQMVEQGRVLIDAASSTSTTNRYRLNNEWKEGQ